MRKLRFLFTSNFYPPYGPESADCRHIQILSAELRARGHEVHVMHSLDAFNFKSSIWNMSPVSKESAEETDLFDHLITSKHGKRDLYFTYLRGKSKSINNFFKKLVNELTPDVVHHHNVSLLGYGLLEKQDNGYLSLCTAHDYWLICQQYLLMKGGQPCKKRTCFTCSLASWKTPQLWRRAGDFKRSVNGLDRIIAPSEFMRNRLSEIFPNNALCVLPNFVLQPNANLDASGYNNFYLYAGFLSSHKGLLTLLEIFKNNTAKIGAKLIIIGSGPLSNFIPKYIAQNNLQDSILFLGRVPNTILYSLYNDALAVILPSVWPENNPAVALEALSFGTPIITSDQGGLPEITTKLDDSLIFSSSNQSSLLDTLCNFNKGKYPAQTVKSIYERFYSPQVFVDRYLDLVKESLDN